jgi:hypothetical protein
MQAKVALKKASALSLLDISICDRVIYCISGRKARELEGVDGGGGGIDREDNVFFFRDGEGAASVGVGSFCWSFVGWPGLGKGEKEKISCHGDSNTIVYSELGT